MKRFLEGVAVLSLLVALYLPTSQPAEQPAATPTASPPGPPAPPPTPAVLDPWANERGTVYLWATAAGWSNTWDDFNQTWSGFTDPANPAVGADMTYWFLELAKKAVEMNVDGIIFSTPSAQSDNDAQEWRMPFEGRMNGLRAGSAVADRSAILNGLVLLRQRFSGKVILYAGYPNDRDPAIVRDRDWCEGYVKASVGPYLDTGVIDAIIVDTIGDYHHRPEARAVVSTIRRLYPRIRLGGEPNPIRIPGQPMKCSFTTRQSVLRGGTMGPARVQPSASFAPVVVGYSTPGRTDLADALEQIRAGRSVAILAWTVGYHGTPTEADRTAWTSFMASAREARARVLAAP